VIKAKFEKKGKSELIFLSIKGIFNGSTSVWLDKIKTVKRKRGPKFANGGNLGV